MSLLGQSSGSHSIEIDTPVSVGGTVREHHLGAENGSGCREKVVILVGERVVGSNVGRVELFALEGAAWSAGHASGKGQGRKGKKGNMLGMEPMSDLRGIVVRVAMNQHASALQLDQSGIACPRPTLCFCH
jgi:hypothetical protein